MVNSNKGPTHNIPVDGVIVDLETTGLQQGYDVIYYIGLYRVRDGELTGDKYEQTINTEGVGIFPGSWTTPELIEASYRSQSMGNYVDDIFDFIGTDTLIVHHSVFTNGFIKRLYDKYYGIELVNEYINLKGDYKNLTHDCLSKYGIHEIGEDLKVRGKYIVVGGVREKISHIYSLYRFILEEVGLQYSSMEEYAKSLLSGASYSTIFKNLEYTVDEESIDKTHIFYGKEVVITGKLDKYDKKELGQVLKNLGGTTKASVTKTTDYLIVGSWAPSTLKTGTDTSGKFRKAEKFRLEGQNIQILTESTLYEILEDGDY